MTNRQDEELLLATVEPIGPMSIRIHYTQPNSNSNTKTIATKITNVAMTSNVNLKLDQYSTMLAHIISPCFKFTHSPHNVLSLSS